MKEKALVIWGEHKDKIIPSIALALGFGIGYAVKANQKKSFKRR